MNLDSHTLQNVYHVLLILVPANQSFLPPSFALILSLISYTDNTFWHTTSSTKTPCQMTPALNPRGRARNASKTPYSRVDAIDNLHPNLQEIIKNCPALDVILDNETPRSSTHSRARDKEHVPRPPNAFMVYRSYVWHTKQLDDNDEKNLSCVSRLAGRSWQVMSDQARYPFRQVADIAKREHAARNPDYKYAPSSRSQTPGKKPPRRVSRAKVKAKAKETATHRDAGFDSLPLSKDTTPTPTSTPPTSSELSCSSPSSPSSPPTSPTLKPEWALILPPPSPTLRYPYDPDDTDYPPQPCVRPVTSGLIPSPSMSVLHLNDAHMPSILDELPDVSPAASFKISPS